MGSLLGNDVLNGLWQDGPQRHRGFAVDNENGGDVLGDQMTDKNQCKRSPHRKDQKTQGTARGGLSSIVLSGDGHDEHK